MSLKLRFRFISPPVAASFLFLNTAAVSAKQLPVAPPTPTVSSASIPTPKREKDGTMQPRFRELHESFLKRGKEGPIGVLFLGDSITEGWRFAKTTWDSHFGKYQPANFGSAGDSTQHVLWRIQQGELDGIKPKVVVLMIGTNNIAPFNGAYSPLALARADFEIVSQIREKLPNTKILLLGIFPRGADPKDPKTLSVRAQMHSVNAALSRLDDGDKIRYLDIGDKFLEPDGSIAKETMRDALHPSAKGYQIWADAMQPLLDEMMR